MKLYDDEFMIKAIRNEYSYDSEIKPTFPEKILISFVNRATSIAYSLIYLSSKLPIISSIVESIARSYSRDAVGFFLRGAYSKTKLKSMGKNVIIDTGVLFWNHQNIEVGDNTHIDTHAKIEGSKGLVKIGNYCHVGSNVVLQGGGNLIIGDYVGIASNSLVYSASNSHEDPENPNRFVNMSVMAPSNEQYILKKPIVIEDHAFIGMGSVVLPGVKIGKGAVIGAGSVVNSDIPPYSIALGIPARVVKRRAYNNEEEN